MAKATSSKPKAKPATPAKPVKPSVSPAKPSPKGPPQPVAKPVAKTPANPAAAPAVKSPAPAKKTPAPSPAPAAKTVKPTVKMDKTPSSKSDSPAPKAAATGKSSPAKPAAAKAPARGPAKKAQLYPSEVAPPADGKHPFLSKAELETFRKALLNLRDRMVDEVQFLSGDNLARNSREASGDLSNYSLHMADQGTDNFDRELALNIVSGDQDTLYEIDEALRRVDNLTYGICELTQQPIEKERLKYVPHARYCMAAAKEMERGKTKYRPFGPTLSQL